MTTPITIEIDSKSVMDALQELQRRGRDMRPVMDAIGQRLEERVSNRFESKTDPEGHPWAPWMPSTKKSYPKNGNGTLLDRDGDMLKGLGHHADANSMTVGFDKPYAYFHEHGTKYMERRGMLLADPASKTLGPEDERSILDLVSSYLAEAI